MPISDYSDGKLQQLVNNYRLKNAIEGGPYTLAEALLEQRRRVPDGFGAHEVTNKIREFSQISGDGFVTYLQIWNAFRRDPWKANYSLKMVGNSLERVAHYCLLNNMPFFNILVVQKGTRSLADKAVQNIYNYYRELGVDVGLDPHAFIEREIERCRSFQNGELPTDPS